MLLEYRIEVGRHNCICNVVEIDSNGFLLFKVDALDSYLKIFLYSVFLRPVVFLFL